MNDSLAVRIRSVLAAVGPVELSEVGTALGISGKAVGELLEARLLYGEERQAILETIGEPWAGWLVRGQEVKDSDGEACAGEIASRIRTKLNEAIVFDRLRKKLSVSTLKDRAGLLAKLENLAMMAT